MEFSDGAWWLLATLAGIAVTVISYFLKRTISKMDDHDRDINKIKQTYVTKTELDAVRSEIRDDVGALKADVKEIKENTLTKADFYRSQTATERKIDKVYDLLMDIKRGGSGREG